MTTAYKPASFINAIQIVRGYQTSELPGNLARINFDVMTEQECSDVLGFIKDREASLQQRVTELRAGVKALRTAAFRAQTSLTMRKRIRENEERQKAAAEQRRIENAAVAVGVKSWTNWGYLPLQNQQAPTIGPREQYEIKDVRDLTPGTLLVWWPKRGPRPENLSANLMFVGYGGSTPRWLVVDQYFGSMLSPHTNTIASIPNECVYATDPGPFAKAAAVHRTGRLTVSVEDFIKAGGK